ncbi:D-isomer specific 2-hydroxyacid dehydrogenase [Lentinula raphanica]|uniref:D-isomer specific 2-hydroxyacid dehydrogenase n=1 Tax=Lentinula raphanica TaxID=153919 RepID=A0AA38PAS8_9AGAR|nr:D-isomer specific 2-hydroxyacid dehydrogenase [Lentinula raphanica]
MFSSVIHQLRSMLSTATTDSKPKVLILNSPDKAPSEYVAQLKEMVEFHSIEQGSHDVVTGRIAEAVKEKGPFVAYVVFINWWSRPFPWPMDQALVGPLVETGCKMISSGGAGYDFVDIKYMSANGVYYANTPEMPALRTADSTAMMILQALRGSSQREADARAGRWFDPATPLAKDARCSTLGIVGMGKIGKFVSQHMQHFGMKVIYHNRNRLPPDEENGAEYVDFETLILRSDVISLHCPLTESTRHLLNKEVFDRMKKDMIIVNTSRGAVIDEDALVEALESRKVLRAALDVYEFEPKIHPGLIASKHTTILPHCAVANETFERDQQTELLLNLETFIKTGKPINAVNDV